MANAHVLIVDDEEDVCAILSRILESRSYSVQTETRPESVLTRLRCERFDVVLLDLVIPAVSGLVLLEQIKSEFGALPVLILTGKGDVGTAVEAMHAGASDFVSKPVDALFLDLRIRQAIDRERTKQMAYTDGLTGLYNHRFFHERLEEEIQRSERYGRSLALAILDIDHFKRFNDTHGHLKGDQILADLAQVLREVCRATDVVARYGGEEFAVILTETNVEDARIFAGRLRDRLKKRCVGVHAHTWPMKITVSIGIAGLTRKRTLPDLVEAADQALYRAKEAGRDQACTE
jgi:two-component system cell cycle response regulator